MYLIPVLGFGWGGVGSGCQSLEVTTAGDGERCEPWAGLQEPVREAESVRQAPSPVASHQGDDMRATCSEKVDFEGTW